MNLNLGERLFLIGRALTGNIEMKPGSTGWKLLSSIMPGLAGAPPNRGTQAQLNGYDSMPWVRAVSGRVGYAVSATQWKLYANKGAPKAGQPARRALLRKDIQYAADPQVRRKLLSEIHDKDELTEITDHPMLDMLNNGNAMHSGMELRKMAQVTRDLVGEAFLMKERGFGKRPVALWPVPPHWIIDTPTPMHQAYRVSFRSWQGEIPATELLWFKDSDPVQPYWRGTGTAQSLADELETDEYSAKYIKQFFYNNARPDVIVSPKGDMSHINQPEMDRLEQSWTQQHGGFWRAFKPMFASRPIEVTPFPQNFQHLQLHDMRKGVRDICLQVWGVPPEILGIIENSNRATIDAADYLFSKWVVVPRLEAWRLDYQRLLVPEYDERLIIDYESPVQADNVFRADIMKSMPWAFEADEVREVAGLSPIEDDLGTFHMQPSNLTYQEDWKKPKPEPLVTPFAGNGKPKPVPAPAQNRASDAKTKQIQDLLADLDDDRLVELAVQLAEAE